MRIGSMGAAATLALALAFAGTSEATADEPDMLAGAIGVYDVLHDNTAAQLRLEYRFGYRLFYISPLLGALATSDGSFYGYGGLRADIAIGAHLIVMPVVAVGYWQRGGGKDLGAHTEFKSGGEVAYRFDDNSRLGLAFDHISNAGIGKNNAGVESLLLVYSVPLHLPR